MRQGSTIPSGRANGEDYVHGDGHGEQVLRLGKEEREKQKLKANVKLDMSFCVLVIETLSECDHIQDRQPYY